MVATPLPFHVDNSIAALESGKHVLCEVPIANSIIPILAAFGQRVAQFAEQAVCEAQETPK